MYEHNFAQYLRPGGYHELGLKAPVLEDVLDFISARHQLEPVMLGDGSDITSVDGQSEEYLAVVGVHTCFGYAAYNPDTKLISGHHASYFMEGDLNAVLDKHQDKGKLYFFSIGSLITTEYGLNTSLIEDQLDFTPAKRARMISDNGLDQEKVYARDARNYPDYNNLHGMALLVIPQLEIAMIFGASEAYGEDRLLETLSLSMP